MTAPVRSGTLSGGFLAKAVTSRLRNVPASNRTVRTIACVGGRLDPVRGLIRSRRDQGPGTSLITDISCLWWVRLEHGFTGNLGLFWQDDLS